MLIGITGASGFIGSFLCMSLANSGHKVVKLVRSPTHGEIFYELGKDFNKDFIKDLDFVIHAAHDFGSRRKEIFEVNFIGSQGLILACKEAGIPMILISSLSAHQETHSEYGKTKLALENQMIKNEWWAIRLGLVISKNPGGILGQIVEFIKSHRFVPIIGGLNQSFRISLIDEVSQGICELLETVPQSGVYLFASKNSVTLEKLANDVSDSLGKKILTFSISPKFAFTIVNLMETFVRIPFRSDSILATMSEPLDSELNSLLKTKAIFSNWDSSFSKLLVGTSSLN
jgi:nucleoside-diphosphate-sugar epimerase